jgi:hypothetical protein
VSEKGAAKAQEFSCSSFSKKGNNRLSLARKVNREIRILNDLFGAELGRTAAGDPCRVWTWSDTFIRPKRVYVRTEEGICPSYRQFAPDPEHPEILTTEPLFVTEKVCPGISNAFILCAWMASPSFAEWRKMWGDTLEWPKGGEYFPVEYGTLGPCYRELPTLDDTLQVIAWIKQDRERSAQAILGAYEKAEQMRQKADVERIRADLDNKLPAYDNIPGMRDFPLEFMATWKPDQRIQPAELAKFLPQKESASAN